MLFPYKKKLKPSVLKLTVISITYLIFILMLPQSPKAYAKVAQIKLLKAANAAYLNNEYSTALDLYRKYLRKKPKDADAWTLSAACYQHLSQPNRALRILKKVYSKTKLKSQNLFYQGLAYDATNRIKLARRYLKQAANQNDAFAALAMFELFAIEYESLNKKRSIFWLKAYQKKFPSGIQIDLVNNYFDKIKNDQIFAIKESQRWAFRKNFYVYSPSSIFPIEHWWGVQLGFNYQINTEVVPELVPTSELQKQPYEAFGPKLKLTFGLGPFTTGDVKYWLGYNYLQYWLSDSLRVSRFLSDPLDFSQFPFRTDLLTRQHQGLFRFYAPITKQLSLKLHSELNIKNSGSSLSGSADRPELQSSQQISSGYLVVPSLLLTLPANNSAEFYLYLKKMIDKESQDLSYKTYEFFDFNKFFTSFGLSYHHAFVDYRANVWADAYRIQYLANDPWEDRTKMGITITADKKWSKLKFAVRGSYYQDDFDRTISQSGGCNVSDSVASQQVVNCKRQDVGMVGQGGLSYTFFNKHIVFISVAAKTLSSPNNLVYDQDQITFQFGYATGFPDRKRWSSFLNAYQRISDDYEGLIP
jgi:tetratricopeptide (TPR) repeat protein